MMVLKPIQRLERLLLVYTKRWLYRNVEQDEKKISKHLEKKYKITELIEIKCK